MVEAALHLVPLRLFVRERRVASGAPIDDVLPTVDEPLLVQPHEHLSYSFAQTRIEGEPGPIPVTAGPDGLELLQDGPPRVLHELPGPLHEGLPPEILPGLSFLGQLPLHHVLGCDAGVVRSRDPEGGPSLHSPPAYEDVLDGVVQAMPHVENRRHIGRGNDDDEGVTPTLHDLGGGKAEIPLLQPIGIEGRLDGLWIKTG